MLTIQSLIDDLAAGCKPKDQWRIGVEHEQFAFDKKTLAPLPYDGKKACIRKLLETFAAGHDWKIKFENGNPIALEKNGMIVSLEPGGQFEYSGSPLSTLTQVRAEMDSFYNNVRETAASLGIDFLPLGFHPQWTREDIHWMPKSRYGIMREHMPKKGGHGIDMMIRTCGAQVNLDFETEQDMIRKYRVSLALQPAITALMANSHMKESADTGYASYRSYCWTDTDPARCGVPAFVFGDDMSFTRYVEYALSVPMIFFRRNEKHIPAAGQSFRAFMEGKLPGHEGELAAMEDWHDHLTTLFPEVRLKRYLELRGPDSNPPDMVLAMAAFWTGIFYNEDALAKAGILIAGWPIAKHRRLRRDAAHLGLEAPVDDRWRNLAALAEGAIDIAANGLPGPDQILLEPFYEKLTREARRTRAAS